MEPLRRFVARELEESLADSPIVLIEGARQVGKSTLAKEVAKGHQSHYVTLDEAPTLEYARFDPVSFLTQAEGGTLIVDEAQRLPELVLPLKAVVDRDRRPGRFLFTGSANLLKVPGVGDSLAGRLSSVALKPFSVGEMSSGPHPEDFVHWVVALAAEDSPLPLDLAVDRKELAEWVCAGGYPEPFFRPTLRRKARWFANYVDRLIGHDAPQLGSGGTAQHLGAFLKRVASLPSQPVVQAKMARQLGVSSREMRSVVELAQTMFLVEELPAWSPSFSNRDTKTPKSSLVDTGLAASLVGFVPEKALQVGGAEYFGALLEQFVVQQLTAQRSWSEESFELFHYRTRDGQEVDLVVELSDGRLILIEVKATQTPTMEAFRTMQNVRQKLGDRVIAGIVLHTGTHTARMQNWMFQLPVGALWRHASVAG